MSSTTPDAPNADGDDDLRVFDVDDDETGALVEILSDPTARAVLACLQSGPATPDHLADAADASPDAVADHLADLAAVGLVAATDRDGDEDPVYEATERAVIEFGDRPDRLRDRPLVKLGVGVVLLAIGGGILQWIAPPGSNSGLLFFLGGVLVLVTWASITGDV